MLAMVAFILSTASTTFAFPKPGEYEIDEVNNTITATGRGVGPENRDPKSSFYKLYARQAAVMDTLTLMMSGFNDIYLESESTIEAGISYDIIRTKLNTVIKIVNIGHLLDVKFSKDGHCETTIIVNISELEKLCKSVVIPSDSDFKFPEPNFPQPKN